MANLKFEEALGRLEEIVKALERGDLALEESLKIFEEGVKLSKTCLKMLDEAEKKVEILLGDKEGKKQPKPYTLNESSSALGGSAGLSGEKPSPLLDTNQMDDERSSNP